MLRIYRAVMAVPIAFASAVSVQGGDVGRIQLAGVKTLSVTPSTSPTYVASASAAFDDDIAVGDTLPLQYMMVIDIRQYQFPRPRDGWVYFEVGQDVLRVDLNSREVLEQMDTLAN